MFVCSVESKKGAAALIGSNRSRKRRQKKLTFNTWRRGKKEGKCECYWKVALNGRERRSCNTSKDVRKKLRQQMPRTKLFPFARAIFAKSPNWTEPTHIEIAHERKTFSNIICSRRWKKNWTFWKLTFFSPAVTKLHQAIECRFSRGW